MMIEPKMSDADRYFIEMSAPPSLLTGYDKATFAGCAPLPAPKIELVGLSFIRLPRKEKKRLRKKGVAIVGRRLAMMIVST